MLILVVPVYNEERNICRLLTLLDAAKLPTRYRAVVLVDDGSTDGTRKAVRGCRAKLPIRYVRFSKNKGPGAAFERGFSVALSLAKDGDLICTMEADTTSDISILGEMIKRALAGNDVVLASCYSPLGGKVAGTSVDRKAYSFVANNLLRLIFPIPEVHTYSSFYRVYTPSVLKRVKAREGRLFTEAGFVCMVELLVQLATFPIRIREVPMILTGSQRDGASSIRIVRTILSYLRVMLRYGLFQRRPLVANRIV